MDERRPSQRHEMRTDGAQSTLEPRTVVPAAQQAVQPTSVYRKGSAQKGAIMLLRQSSVLEAANASWSQLAQCQSFSRLSAA